jgi:hypothetical protein
MILRLDSIIPPGMPGGFILEIYRSGLIASALPLQAKLLEVLNAV